METLATGFRNPNGMGVRPDGKVITVAPQQGDWTPSSGIWEIHEGLYGGWGGPRVTAQRTDAYDAPLCWIPHGVDNSSGSQVWIPEGQWGPLGGQMLHLLWGRCGLMLALRDTDPSGIGINGAVVALPARFLSGPNRATFNPVDNSLLVAGSTGWQTSAVKDGAVQRVRFTGKPVALPIGWKAVAGGVEVRFSQPVDPATAQDPGSYSVRVWNYRYAQQIRIEGLARLPTRQGRPRGLEREVRHRPIRRPLRATRDPRHPSCHAGRAQVQRRYPLRRQTPPRLPLVHPQPGTVGEFKVFSWSGSRLRPPSVPSAPIAPIESTLYV
jgi:hypothetical protein